MRSNALINDLSERLSLRPNNAAAALGTGNWRAGHGQFASLDPTTGEVLGYAGRATHEDVEALVFSACEAFLRWRQVPAPLRGLFVRDLAEALRSAKNDLALLIALEVGKIQSEAEGEVQEMIDIADFAVGLSRRLEGSTLASERPQHRMFEQWQPLGPVAVVTAFNFPAAVWAWNAMIAIVCGDSVVWKPSPKAPLTAIAIQHLVEAVAARHQAQGVCSLLLSDEHWPTEQLAADPRLPLFSFTGSSAVGQHLAPIVAGRFGRSLLECSGNNALIVDASADLELAIPAIVFGAAGTAGQRCTTTRRLLVHASLHDALVQRLRQIYPQLPVGDPLYAHTLVGPLIDESARQNFLHAVEETVAHGGKLLSGGKAKNGPGYFVEPTLIASHNDWPSVQRETFGPLLHVMPFADIDQAIALNNAVPQGLSSSLFTNDLRHAERFLSAVGSDCGIANVNLGTSGAEVGGAFGGEKATGGGREAGSEAWKTYMRRQTTTINGGHNLPLAQGIVFDIPSTSRTHGRKPS